MGYDPLGTFSWKSLKKFGEGCLKAAAVAAGVAVAVIVVGTAVGGTIASGGAGAIAVPAAVAIAAEAIAISSAAVAVVGTTSIVVAEIGTSSSSFGNNSKKDYVKAKNNKQANEWAKDVGYNGAEELKADFVGKDGSKFNIYTDRSTGEIILKSIKNGVEIPTNLFR